MEFTLSLARLTFSRVSDVVIDLGK